MSLHTADLAIIGAGASATHTMLALLRELSSAATNDTSTVRIVIIDRDQQFFSGVAYGNRSGRTSLTLSTLRGFLPDEERARLIEWLESRREAIWETADPAWVDQHRADITAGRWEDLFIPRRLYGEYLADCASAAMQDARSRGIATFALVTANVSALDRSDDGLLITATGRDGGTMQIAAAVAVLATGSPPTRLLGADDVAADGLIHDIYEPGLDATLAQVHRRLADLPVDGRRVLVVGGNAAALEFVLASHTSIRDLRARITVLSPLGRPHHWRRRRDGEVAELTDVNTLRTTAANGGRVTAAALYEAVASDLRTAIRSGTNIAAVRDVFESIPFFLDFLDEEDRAGLAARYGLTITNLLRQDCGDAIDILEACVESGIVDFATGRFAHCRSEGKYFSVDFRDAGGRERLLDARYGAIVGTTGFEGVSGTRAPLIQQLLQAGVVEASSSDAGLRVDEEFRAAGGVYVVGPLLAGNAHPSMLIWHAESVRRIIAIASDAAPCIARELRTLGQEAPRTLADD